MQGEARPQVVLRESPFRPDRLSAAATLTRARASTSTGLVDGSGAVLWPGFRATALALLLTCALTLVRILVAILAGTRGIQRED
jgi:hypothetical protein